MVNLFGPKQERPFLRLCKQCGGKGQLSYYDQFQRKTYGPCKGCSNQLGPYALGVSLKCRCQKPAVTYSFVFGPDVKQFKKWKREKELVELYKFQKSLGEGGNALLLLCDTCNAKYLAQDGAGERRKINTTEEMNEADKEYNRHIARTLVQNGIIREIDAEDGTTLPTRLTEEVQPLIPMATNPVSVNTQEPRTVPVQPHAPATTSTAIHAPIPAALQIPVASTSLPTKPSTGNPFPNRPSSPRLRSTSSPRSAPRQTAPTPGAPTTSGPLPPSPFSQIRQPVSFRERHGITATPSPTTATDMAEDAVVPAPPSVRRSVSTPRAAAAAALASHTSVGSPRLPAPPGLGTGMSMFIDAQPSLGSPLASALSKAKMRTNSLFSLTESEVAEIQKVTIEEDEVPVDSPATRTHVEPLRPQENANDAVTPVNVS